MIMNVGGKKPKPGDSFSGTQNVQKVTLIRLKEKKQLKGYNNVTFTYMC